MELESLSLALSAMFLTVHNVGPTQITLNLLLKKKLGFNWEEFLS
jgi:hypothetical protein